MPKKIRRFLSPHMQELKVRLLRTVGVFLGLFAISFCWGEELFQWLAAPLYKTLAAHHLPTEMIYTHMAEAFSTYVQVAFFAAFLLTFPYLEWEIWQFSSFLLKKERRTSPSSWQRPYFSCWGRTLLHL